MTTTRAIPRWYGPEDFDGPQDDHYLEGLDEFDHLDAKVGAIMQAVDPELWREYSNVLSTLVVAAERSAVLHHGVVVAAAIRGDLVADKSCMPEWRNRPAGH